jgi:DNA-binding CsgD family transcriptional regulator
MDEVGTVILSPDVSAGGDVGLQQAFELFVTAAGATWGTFDLKTDRSATRRTITCGTPAGPSITVELVTGDDVAATVTLAGTEPPPQRLLDSLAGSIDRELQRQRLWAENTLLRSGIEAVSAAILLFDPSGAIVFANGPGDRLLSKQTEDELTVNWNGQGPQPLFRLVCARVAAALDDLSQGAWRARLELSDGTELASEIIPLELSKGCLNRIVLAVLREVGLPPERRIGEFANEHGLSPREQEVLELLVEGHDTVGMAERLGISPHTVRDHVKHVLRKTSSRSRSELLSAIASASTFTG